MSCNMLAHPLETIPANEEPAARVAEIVREKKVDHVVAGIPRQMNGQIGTAATEVLDFVEKLRAILPCLPSSPGTSGSRLSQPTGHCVTRKENSGHARLRGSGGGANDFAELSGSPRRAA